MAVLDQHIPALAARSAGSLVPLTQTQMWTWNDVLQRQPRRSRARLCAASIRLIGELQVESLERSIEAVLGRHESLRTRISEVEGIAVQRVDSMCGYSLPIVDFTATAEAQREAQARELAEYFTHEDVDLSSDRIFEAKLLKIADSDHVLILCVDHIIADAVSCTILADEVWQIYESIVHCRHRPLAPLRLQFPDFAAWQHATHADWVNRHSSYWDIKLRNVPSLRIPYDYDPTNRPTAAVVHVPFGKHLTDRLREMASVLGTRFPLFVLTLYCCHAFLRYERRDVLVALLSHGRRSQPDLKQMIGELAHCTYLRLELNPRESLRDLANRVTVEFESASARDASHIPPFPGLEFPTDLFFNWLPATWNRAREGLRAARPGHDNLIRRSFPLKSRTPVTFLPLFSDGPTGLVLTILHRSDLFKRSTMQRIGSDLRWLAVNSIAKAHVSLGSFVFPS